MDLSHKSRSRSELFFSFVMMTEDDASHMDIELAQSLNGSLHDILPERRANSM